MRPTVHLEAPLRVAIAGCGNVSLNDHAPAYLALPQLFRVIAVADPSAERRRLVGDRLGLAPADEYADVAEMLTRPDIDVLDICTPPAMHRALAEQAALRGHHILCEKPLATTPEDAEAIVRVAGEAGVVLGMMHNYLFFPEVAALRDLISRGSLGAVQMVMIDALGIDDNPGAAAFRPRWRHEPGAGGGVLMDLIHLVYLAEALLGEPIVRVSAAVDAIAADAQVESLAACRFEGANGIALVNVGWGDGPGGLRVSGTAGRADVRYRDGATGPYIPIESATAALRKQAPGILDVSGARDSHRLALQDFGAALLTGRPPRADGHAGSRAVAATVGAYQSAAMGRTISLPLDAGGPPYRLGTFGLAQLPLVDWSPIRRRGLFGVAKEPA
jgi:predicted dehydrogenase